MTRWPLSFTAVRCYTKSGDTTDRGHQAVTVLAGVRRGMPGTGRVGETRQASRGVPATPQLDRAAKRTEHPIYLLAISDTGH
jgi:hypothetical protein